MTPAEVRKEIEETFCVINKENVIDTNIPILYCKADNTQGYSNIQRDATLHRLFHLETALRVTSGTSTHHQERKQLYLQHLVIVTPLLLPAAIVEELELV